MNIREIPMLTALSALFFITGCGLSPIVMIADEVTSKSSYVNDCFHVPAEPENIMDIVSETGKSLGWSVQGKTSSGVTFRNDSSLLSEYVLGVTKIMFISVHKKFQPGTGKSDELCINIAGTGGFGTTSQEKVDKLLSDFKQKVLEKIESQKMAKPTT